MTEGRQLFVELWSFYEQQLAPRACRHYGFAQLVTYLLFLKLDDERSKRPVNRVQVVPDGLGWQTLVHKDGQATRRSVPARPAGVRQS